MLTWCSRPLEWTHSMGVIISLRATARTVHRHLNDVTFGVQRGIPFNLNYHTFNERRELPLWRLVAASLVCRLHNPFFINNLLKESSRHRRTSSNRPSTLNDHAGIPSPVSTFVVGWSVPVCHTCPDVEWLRNIRNVRVVCHWYPEINPITKNLLKMQKPRCARALRKNAKERRDVRWVFSKGRLALRPSSSS